MGPNTIEQAFIKQYEADAHLAYQRAGSALRSTVRQKNNVVGKSTTFQIIGKGEASTKARHGKITPMNPEHTSVECTLADHYAGDYIDKLDEAKTNVDERGALVKTGANALGRKTDRIIVEALDTSTNFVLDGTTGLTKAKALAAMELLGNNDVPDDGDRIAVVGWRQWAELLQIEEFTKAEYVGVSDLPWPNASAKKWLGTMWMPFSGLTKTGTVRHCYWYHKSAVGHASGAEISVDISWIGDRAAHFVNHMMSQGAVLIDPTGVVSLRCLEN